MARQFLQQNNLHNVVGRIEYIRGDTGKQEHMEAFYSTIDDSQWKSLAEFNQKKFKQNKKGINKKNKKAIEGREIILHMPHKYYSFPYSINGTKINNAQDLAKYICDDFNKKFGTDCCVAIHWNKSMTNFHVHLIYSERKQETKRANRNFYYDSNWKKCKKAESVHMIKKGDVISEWCSEKESKFKSKSYLENTIKLHYASLFELERYRDDGLHLKEQKSFKISESSSLESIELHDRITEYNNNVKQWNRMVDEVLVRKNKQQEYSQFIDNVMRPAVVAHKRYRKHHKEYLAYMIERVRDAFKELVERIKSTERKQSTTSISFKNYKQITKQKPFKPKMVKTQKKVKIYDHDI